LRERTNMKKLVYALLIGFLIASIAYGVSNQAINAANTPWNQTIQINADGSITPANAPLQQNGNIYTLTNDITYYTQDPGVIISIQKDDIILDGAQHTISGSGLDTGINIEGQQNITLKNTKIMECSYCIKLSNASNNQIISNDMQNEGRYSSGILLQNSNYNTISENNISNNYYYAIELLNSKSNNFTGNNIVDNNFNISLDETSTDNTFTENNITPNN